MMTLSLKTTMELAKQEENKELTVLRNSLKDPVTFCNNITVTNLKTAFLSKTPSIAGLSFLLNESEHHTVKALLNIMIGDLVLFLNVGKNMSPGQIIETASLIIKHYGHLKPEDFKLCFENIKMGVYGSLYDRMDGQAILVCLRTFDNERDYIAAEVASNINELHKMDIPKTLMLSAAEIDDEKQREIFDRNMALLKSNLTKNKIGREKDKVEVTVTTIQDPVYLLHQNWFKQYDLIWKRQGYPKRITRYGIIKNPFFHPGRNEKELIKRTLDKNEYLEYKQWQYTVMLPAFKKRNNNAENIK